MKSKIVVLGICVLLSACGLGKGDRNQQTKEDENRSEILNLKNLKDQNFSKVQQVRSGNQYHFLGTFDAASIPAEMRSLATESEIGSLSVEFEDETYAEKYSGEVSPVFNKRQQEIKTTVYLLKEGDSPNQITFAIKKDENAKQVSVSEVPVTVQSSLREYCNQVHLPFQQGKGMEVLDQIANCDPNENCIVMFNIDGVGPFKGGITTKNTELNKGVVESICTSHLTHYYGSEIKLNRSVPKKAAVSLNPAFSNGLHHIVFDL